MLERLHLIIVSLICVHSLTCAQVNGVVMQDSFSVRSLLLQVSIQALIVALIIFSALVL